MQIKKPITNDRKALRLTEVHKKFIKEISVCPESDIPKHIANFGAWEGVRGDLLSWIPVLNRFDSIYEKVIKEYQLDGSFVSTSFFSSYTEDLLIAILDFTQTLLEHCSNRSVYSSGSHLSSLLYSLSIPVLIGVLKVCDAIGLRYALSQSGKTTVNAVSQEKIFKLTDFFPPPIDNAEINITMTSLIDPNIVWDKKWYTLEIQYYHYGEISSENQLKSLRSSTHQSEHSFTSTSIFTPTKSKHSNQKLSDKESNAQNITENSTHQSSEGLSIFRLSPEEISSLSFKEILKKVFENVPKEFWFDALNKARVAKAFAPGPESLKMRIQLAIVKSYSVAYISSVASDTALFSKLFIPQPQLVNNLCTLINPDSHSNDELRVAALRALESLSRHRDRLSEILACLSANVSHGTLMYIYRTLIQQASTGVNFNDMVACNVITLTHSLGYSHHAAQLMLTAGIMPLLVEILRIETPHLRFISKVVALTDHIIYISSNALSTFIEASGLDTLIFLVGRETDYGLSTLNSDALSLAEGKSKLLPYKRIQLLRTLFKFILHMLQSSGHADQLRNLIDSSLLKSLRDIISYPEIFGASVIASSLNVLSTFLHNEPTSYSIIHEAKLPETFVNAIPQMILPSSELLSAISQVFGAICLNYSGRQLIIDSKAIYRFFALFNSKEISEELCPSEMSMSLGNSFDELVRHNPPLKEEVLKDISLMLKDVLKTCADYKFEPVSNSQSNEESMIYNKVEAKNSDVASIIENTCSFLDGFAINAVNIKELGSAENLGTLLKFFALETLPYDFGTSAACQVLCKIISQLYTQDAVQVAHKVLTTAAEDIEKTQQFMSFNDSSPYIKSLSTPEEVSSYLVLFSKAIAYLNLINHLYGPPLVTRARNPIGPAAVHLLNCTEHKNFLPLIFKLLPFALWEDIVLTESFSVEWRKLFSSNISDSIRLSEAAKEEIKEITARVDTKSPSFINAKIQKYVYMELWNSISKLIVGISKSLQVRLPTLKQKKDMLCVGDIISHNLLLDIDYSRMHNSTSPYAKAQYHLMLISIIKHSMIDEIVGPIPAHFSTCVALGFLHRNGVEIISNVLSKYWEITPVEKEKELVKNENSVYQSGINIIKLIVQMFVKLSQKDYIVNSQQSSFLSHRDRDKDRISRFNSMQIVIEFRLQLYPHMCSLLQSCLLPFCYHELVPTVLSFFNNFLEDGVEPGPADYKSSKDLLSWQKIYAYEVYHKFLVDFGVDPKDAEEALIVSSCNIRKAVDYIFAHYLATHSRLSQTEPFPVIEFSGISGYFFDCVPYEGESAVKYLKTLKHKVLDYFLDIAFKLLRTCHNDKDIFAISSVILSAAQALVDQSSISTQDQNSVYDKVINLIMSEYLKSAGNDEYLDAVFHLFGILMESKPLTSRAFEILAPEFGNFLNIFEKFQTETTVALKWLPSYLLVLEKLLSESLIPQYQSKTYEKDIVPQPKIICIEPKEFVRISKILCSITDIPDERTAVSLARIFIILTREYNNCAMFIESGLLIRLLQSIRRFPSKDSAIRSALVVVFRHLCETPEVLSKNFEYILKLPMLRPRTRVLDVKGFIRNNHFLIMRNYDLFLQLTGKDCKLTHSDLKNPAASIVLKDSVILSKKQDIVSGTAKPQLNTPVKSAATPMKNSTKEFKTPSLEYSLGIIHILVSELLSIKDDVTSEPVEDKNLKEAGSHPKGEFKIKDNSQYLYKCFILQVLIELLSSYTQCKFEFINFSKRLSNYNTPSKPRSTVFNYFFNELISQVPFQFEENIENKKKVVVSNLSSSVIFALLLSVKETQEEDEYNMNYIRKFTLDSILRYFREASVILPLNLRYGKIRDYCELCNRLISSRRNESFSSGVPLNTDELLNNSNAISKLMYEKNFVGVFTALLGDIDINFPQSQKVIKSIMKPLESVTKQLYENVSILELGKSSEQEEDELSVASSEDYREFREETPDLFRNSTLGMFDPGEEMADEIDDEVDVEEDQDSSDISDEAMGREYEEDGDENGQMTYESDSDMSLSSEDSIHHMDVELVLDGDGNEELVVNGGSSDFEDNADEDENENDLALEEDSLDEDDIDNYNEEIELEDDIDDIDLEDEDDDDEDDDAWEDEEIDDENSPILLSGASDSHHILRIPDSEFGNDGIIHAQLGLGNDEDIDEDEDEDDDDDDDEVEEDGVFDELEFDTWDIEAENDFDAHSNWPRYRNSARVFSHSGIDFNSRNLLELNSNSENARNPLLNVSNDTPSTFMTSITAPRNNSGFLSLNHDLTSEINNSYSLFDSDIDRLIRQVNRSIRMIHGNESSALDATNGTLIRQELERMLRHSSRFLTKPIKDDPVNAISSFSPHSTSERMRLEFAMFYGQTNQALIDTLCSNVQNSILNLLIPAIKEEEDAKKKEEERKKEERAKVEREEREKKEREEKEAKEKEAKEKASATLNEPVTSAEPMDGVDTNVSTEVSTGPVYVSISGQQIDVSNLGIDPTFLEALPEEMREEVFTSHLNERRIAASSGGSDTQPLDREFLDALPRSIQRELLHQESIERRSNTMFNSIADYSVDMDPQLFFATLNPELRQSILLEADEDSLSQLPPDIAAEAYELRSRPSIGQSSSLLNYSNGVGTSEVPSTSNLASHSTDETTKKKDVTKKNHTANSLQLIDKPGIASLLRLLFVVLTRSQHDALNNILYHICSNKQTRIEVVSLLLHILIDATTDKESAEKVFLQLSNRAHINNSLKNSQNKAANPVFTTAKTSNLNEVLLPENREPVQRVITRQCLEVLDYLARLREHLPAYFLTEHEGLVFKRHIKNKGKGKEKESDTIRAAKTPLNDLIGLLRRPVVRSDLATIDILSGLLQQITRPLQLLNRRKQNNEDEENSKEKDEKKTNEKTEISNTNMDSSQSKTGDITNSSSKADTVQKRDEDKPSKRELTPPYITNTNLKLIISILTADECSSSSFQQTITTLQYLSYIPGACDIFGNELVNTADKLGKKIFDDLNELMIQIDSASAGSDLQGKALSKFSLGSSDQAKLLRVLTALDYLFDPSRHHLSKDGKTNANYNSAAIVENFNKLSDLYEKLNFGPIWKNLSVCLDKIKDKSDMLHVATALLPLIESLMVVCKHGRMNYSSLTDLVNNSKETSVKLQHEFPTKIDKLFFSFTEDHRKLLNQMVRNNPKLMSGSFSILIKNPKVLEFDNKREYFNRKLQVKPANRRGYPNVTINVRRDQVFLDSYKALYYKSGDEIKFSKLIIRFRGEEGVDAGGLTREWFQVLSRQMFNPDYALFMPVASDRTTFHPNRTSGVNPEHLLFFKFIGRIIGKALFENRVLDCHFSRALYKRMLGREVSLKDMETVDLEYYKSLLWMLDNDITDVITETFSIESDEYGVKKVEDLIPNGRNIPVTEENKAEFVRLVVDYRLIKSVESQIQYFLQGFHEIIPKDLVSIFNEQELELLISGLPDIDVDDWRNNTEYHNYTASSPQIQWFWRAIRSFDAEERAKLLQFVTGTSKVPFNGFRELEGMNGFAKFNIHREYGNKERLPSSHTCFNQLDLPEYESYEALRKYLLLAITEGKEGFGFA